MTQATVKLLSSTESAHEASHYAADMYKALEKAGWSPHPAARSDLLPSLAHLLDALDWRGDIRQLTDAVPPRTGYDVFDVVNSMMMLGFGHRTSFSLMQDVPEDQMPCLFVQGENYMSGVRVLIRRQGEHVIGYDQESETMHALTHPQRNVPGTVYHFFPLENTRDQIEEHAQRKSGITWFQQLLSRFGSSMLQLFITGILINIAALAVPLFVMSVYNKVIGGYSLYSLKYLLCGIVIAIAVEAALRYYRIYALSWFGARVNHLVSTSIFQQLLYLPALFVEHASVTSQLARLKAFESVRDFFTGPMFLVVLELPFVLFLLGVVALIAGPIVAIPIAAAIVLFFFSMTMMKRMRLQTFRLARAASERQQLAVEGIAKLRAVRGGGLADIWLKRYSDHSVKCARAGFQSDFTASILEHGSHAITLITVITTIVAGIERIWADQMTAGALVAVMILTWRIMNPMQNLCAMLPAVGQVVNSIAQVNKLMTLPPERHPQKSLVTYKPFVGHVFFHHVSLRFSRAGDPVLSGLTFEAAPGECIAIAGGNGSGKSTILRLCAGLYTPQGGTIRIDGTDIRQLDPIVMRREITFVPQTPEFFSGTILENLQLTHPTVTEAEVIAILKELEVWDDVLSLPNKLHTRIGQGESGLPSTLLYCLNLARAMIAPCSIILCDELPYAVLTSKTGEKFKKFLKSQRGIRTVLLVAHREDYMQLADKLVVLRTDKPPVIAKPDAILPQLRKARA